MFYDSKNGTILGRNCASWTKILAFYAVYYTFLGFLFYGTIKVYPTTQGQYVDVAGEKQLIGKPYIFTRTDQPGMDVWPHQAVQGNDDGNGQGLILQHMQAKAKDGKANDNAVDPYDPATDKKNPIAYSTVVTDYLLNACPFENSCKLKDWHGADWATVTGIDFLVAGEDAKEPNDKSSATKC